MTPWRTVATLAKNLHFNRHIVNRRICFLAVQRLPLVCSSKRKLPTSGSKTSFLPGSRCYTQQIPQTKLKTMKLDTPEFQSIFTPELKALVGLFEKHGYELRVAGGAVRDLLSKKIPHDLDFATTATPDEMIKLFEREEIRTINMGGLKHGTVTCRINDKENFEVTTLRIDLVTDGRHAEVQFTTDWQLDAFRRDLTVNAMFLGFDGTVYDYSTGIEDLEQKRVRFVGDAVRRIQEDYLRILRYFRFFGRIALDATTHDEEAISAIQENMDGLSRISGERIWVELKKILVGNHAAAIVRKMMSLGLSKYVGLPPSPDVDEFAKAWSNCHDLDPLPLTVLAALMRTEDEVYKMNERLKLSRDELRLGLFIVKYRHAEFGSDALKFCKELFCDTAATEPKSMHRIKELLKYRGERQTLVAFDLWEPPKFPVSGFRLLERGVSKGPVLSKTLSFLRQKWKESGFRLTEDELLEYLDTVIKKK